MVKETKKELSGRAKSDLILVKKALEGDEKAFARLMLRYRDSVYYMLLKMVKNKSDAEDLTLEAFGKAFANLEYFSPDYAFSTWIFKIAINNCIDFLRKQKGIHFSFDSLPDFEFEINGTKLKSPMPTPEEGMILQQRFDMLHSYVEKLKPNYRELIHLRYFKEYSYEEIAKALNLPLGTVKVQLFRARNMLYKLLEETDVNE
jgi:RNA polymerase sigma-70 factor (ECF subfamily)